MTGQCRFLLLFALAVVSRPNTASADTAAGPMVIVTDTKEDFRAIGSLTTIDTDVPPNGISSNALVIDGDKWDFFIVNEVADWRIPVLPPPVADNGADDARIWIDGIHQDGPHDPPGPPVDDDPNILQGQRSPAQDIGFGGKGTFFRQCRVKHFLEAGGNHWDHYGVKQEATPLQGPPHLITGPTVVAAKHSGQDAESLPYGLTLGSSQGTGSNVSYDAPTGTLAFNIGPIDILNADGTLTPGIDVAYQSDTIQPAQLVATNLHFQGIDQTGAFKFSGGRATITTPDQTLGADSYFSEYLIRDTSPSETLTSYALLDSLWAADVGECLSEFLDDFIDVNCLGQAIPSADWRAIQGIDFTFVTPGNLAAMTQGFTQSVFAIPATFAICANANYSALTSVRDQEELGAAPRPSRSHPNPFDRGTHIEYSTAEAAPVSIEIFDAAGQLVRRLVTLREQAAGRHSAFWDGTDEKGRELPAGMYLYRVAAGSRTESNRLVLVR